MEIKKTRYGLVCVFAIGFLILLTHSVHAADELFLSGVVKDIDYTARAVLVDVKSSSCKGIRRFAIPYPSQLDGLVGKRIDFFIDSSTCKRDETYTMFPRRGRENK